LPLVYPTIVVYVTTGLATIFTNQLNLYSFYQGGADYTISTMGYWFYKETAAAAGEVALFPYLSAVGLIFTFLALPMTFGGRWLMNKLGPKTE
jgi:ABC-type sugar transport system permease subunit